MDKLYDVINDRGEDVGAVYRHETGAYIYIPRYKHYCRVQFIREMKREKLSGRLSMEGLRIDYPE